MRTKSEGRSGNTKLGKALYRASHDSPLESSNLSRDVEAAQRALKADVEMA